MKIGEFLTESNLAKLYGCSTRHIRDLAAKGVVTKSERGYPAWDTIHAIIQHFRAGSRGDERETLAAAKLRTERLKGDALERQKDVDEGRLLTLDQVRAVAMDVVPRLRKLLRSTLMVDLPAECAGRSEAQLRAYGAKTYAETLKKLQKPHKALESGRLADAEGAAVE